MGDIEETYFIDYGLFGYDNELEIIQSVYPGLNNFEKIDSVLKENIKQENIKQENIDKGMSI